MTRWNETDYAVVAALSGRLDQSTVTLQREAILERAAASAKPLFVLDLAEVDFAGSEFIRLVITLAKLAGQRTFGFALVGAQGSLRQLLELGAIDRMVPVVATLEEACRLWQERPQAVRLAAGVACELTPRGVYKIGPGTPQPGQLHPHNHPPQGPGIAWLSGGRHAFHLPGHGWLEAADGAAHHHGLTLAEELEHLLHWSGPSLPVRFRCRWPKQGVPMEEVIEDLRHLGHEQRGQSATLAVAFVHDAPAACGTLLIARVAVIPQGEAAFLTAPVPFEQSQAPDLLALDLALGLAAHLGKPTRLTDTTHATHVGHLAGHLFWLDTPVTLR